jgi:hypothetical protein|tara:strand:+ start:118 stop:285 length:168 start_codon:yes stop_codon:yes gene_type:complete
MAANLMGAIFGGLLEYNSMKFGILSLYLLGIALYAIAAAFFIFRPADRPGAGSAT